MRPVLLLVLCLAGFAPPATAQTTVAIDVFSAYLHVDPADVTNPAIPILLAGLGIAPGDSIHLQCSGDWDPGPGGDTQTNLLAVFSSSATLLSTTLLHRVPGALGTALTNFSGGTWPGNEPTEIPEDFLVSFPGVAVTVPAGATHLFVTPADIYYRDNEDPDSDLGVTLTRIATTAVPIGGPARSRLALVAHPNPVVSETSFAFELAATSDVKLVVHDLAGRRVRTLFQGSLPAGEYLERWDSRDDSGRRVEAGSYFARLESAGRAVARKLLVLR